MSQHLLPVAEPATPAVVDGKRESWGWRQKIELAETQVDDSLAPDTSGLDGLMSASQSVTKAMKQITEQADIVEMSDRQPDLVSEAEHGTPSNHDQATISSIEDRRRHRDRNDHYESSSYNLGLLGCTPVGKIKIIPVCAY